MRRLIRQTLLLVITLSPKTIWAAELKLFLKDNQLGALIHEVQYPDSLSRDLTSGLSNKILIQFTLSVDSRPSLQKYVEIIVKYDLWNENFHLSTSGDGKNVSQNFKNIKEVLAWLKELKMEALFQMKNLDRAQAVSIQSQILLNPVERERLEKVKKWVTQNSTSTAPSEPGRSLSTAGRSSRSTLFNKIFEQYSDGQNVAAIWKTDLSSTTLPLSEVPREK